MSDDRDGSDLPKNAEALLVDWPAPDRGALDWEQCAERTISAVRQAATGSTSDSLLEAPLPLEAEEPAEWPLRAEIEELSEEAPGLAQIARAVVETGPAADPELDAVAKETLSLASRVRPKVVQARPSARRAGVAEVAALQGRITPDRPIRVDVARSPAEPTAIATRRERVWIAVSGVTAAFAIAAAALMYVRTNSTPHENVTLPVTAPAPKAQRVAEVPVSPQAQAAETAPVVTLDELPKRQASGSATASGVRSLAVQAPAASPKPGAAPAATVPAKNTGELPEDKDMRPAVEMAVGTKPSVGEVQGAFGTVMPAARQCLAGQDSGSQVAVTFGPDGRVQQVAVMGAAAGTPAEACLSNAFQRARVAPFSDPNFSAKITVRPP